MHLSPNYYTCVPWISLLTNVYHQDDMTDRGFFSKHEEPVCFTRMERFPFQPSSHHVQSK